MQEPQAQLCNNVMRRVRRIHIWRTIGRPFIAECVLLVGLIYSSVFFISLKNILINAYNVSSPFSVFRFSLLAFENTQLSMKALSLAVLILCGLITRDTISGMVRIARKVRSA